MNAFDRTNDPPAVLTVALILPIGCAGVVILNDVAVLLVTGTEVPSTTTLAPLRLVPVMVTIVPPQAGPDVGLIDEMVGTAEAT